jgi:hypothetical protein
MTAAVTVMRAVSEGLAAEFEALFVGLHRAYGRSVLAPAGAEGEKREAQSRTVRASVTSDLYRKHLNGIQGLGVIPIRDDGTVRFGAVDIDRYIGLDLHALDRRVNELELPLVVARSKSGGAHLYLFCREDISADLVNTKLAEWASALGHEGVEVFPKQKKLRSNGTGNWINLPYFGGDQSERHAIQHGERLSLAAFLQVARKAAVTKAELEAIAIPKQAGAVLPTPAKGERNTTLFRRACALRRLGYGDATIRAALDELNARCERPLPESELDQISRNVVHNYEPAEDTHLPEDAASAIQDLNARFAVVQVADKVRILQEQPDGEFVLMPREEFRALHSNRVCEVGQKLVTVGDAWLRAPDRRQYSRIVFEPGGTRTENAYNLFRGFAVQPRPGDCSLFLAHVRDNICQGNEAHYRYFMTWAAQMFQQPNRKPGTAVVLRGKQGTGKTLVGKTLGRLLGPHYALVASAHRVTGHFNSHLERCLLLHADEAFWAGDKQAEGALKDLVTNDVQWIERKGVDAFAVANHVRLLVCSNSHWVVPAGPEERRFFTLDVGEGRMQDAAYFRAMLDQLENGGYEALLHELMTWDCSQVDLRVIPTTAALQDQKVASLPAETKWWLDILMSGQLPGDSKGTGETSKECLHQDYCVKAQRLGFSRKSSATELGIMLHKLVPGIREGRHSAPGGKSWRTYRFPPLAVCRAEFERMVKQPINWGDDEGQWQPDGRDDDWI